MGTTRISVRLLTLGALLAALPGCVSMPGNRPVAVLVRDAETKKPIANADVQFTYPLARAFYEPPSVGAKTTADGTIRLASVPAEGKLINLETKAPGYLFEMKEVTPKSIETIERAHFLESLDRRTPNFVVDLYAEPRPTIELVVPVGYKGIIKANVRVKDDAVVPVGQRNFTLIVDEAGECAMSGSALLSHVGSSDFVAKFTDGTPIKRNAKEPEVGFWWLKKEGDCEHFFVGTEREFTALRHADRHTVTDNPRSSGGGGRGGGGGVGGARRGGGRGGM